MEKPFFAYNNILFIIFVTILRFLPDFKAKYANMHLLDSSFAVLIYL